MVDVRCTDALFTWSKVAFETVVLAIREHLKDAGSAWLRTGTYLGVSAVSPSIRTSKATHSGTMCATDGNIPT